MVRVTHVVIVLHVFAAKFCYSQNLKENTNQSCAVNNPAALATLVTLTPSQGLTDPKSTLNTWAYIPLSVNGYSAAQQKIQIRMNDNIPDGIIASSKPENKSEWTEIDVEPITPYTWKWIDVDLVHNDGSHSTAQLRRPNWWIKKIKADKIGNRIYLDLPQMGMQGVATVVGIRVNQLDSRLVDEQQKDNFVYRPITGKFTHESKNVYRLYFDDSEKNIGVTGNHLIWSTDRKGWIRAQELKSQERVNTYYGTAIIKAVEKQEGNTTVYNLEIYRDHNYYASLHAVLVHNECWNASWERVLSDWRKIAYDAGEPHGWASARTENGVRRVILNYEYAVKDLGLNSIPNTIRLEERTAIGERARAIVVKIMMPDDGFSSDNILVVDMLQNSGHYKEVRAYSENGMNWVEGIKGQIPTPQAPDASQVSTTIPVR